MLLYTQKFPSLMHQTMAISPVCYAGVGVYNGPRGLDAVALRSKGACDGGGIFFLPPELCRVNGGCPVFSWRPGPLEKNIINWQRKAHKVIST